VVTQQEICAILKGLAQLDIDAVMAYTQAIANVDDEDISELLKEFCRDHERHFEEISEMIQKFGKKPPVFSRDFKGFFIVGMIEVMSKTGLKSALRAMRQNEKLTNKRYKEALDRELPTDVRILLERNYHDEQVHLDLICECLAEQEPGELRAYSKTNKRKDVAV